MDEYKGEFPKELEVLINRLPGVGRYTAGAVSSIAFSQVLRMNLSKLDELLFPSGKSHT